MSGGSKVWFQMLHDIVSEVLLRSILFTGFVGSTALSLASVVFAAGDAVVDVSAAVVDASEEAAGVVVGTSVVEGEVVEALVGACVEEAAGSSVGVGAAVESAGAAVVAAACATPLHGFPQEPTPFLSLNKSAWKSSMEDALVRVGYQAGCSLIP
mmetsp:Transcript_38797/g.87359  ORF Transcript_38797/g.87359 Transcript_38797/m.87359 type:complete len:155 (+) Transcript_38797:642-1106(+)